MTRHWHAPRYPLSLRLSVKTVSRSGLAVLSFLALLGAIAQSRLMPETPPALGTQTTEKIRSAIHRGTAYLETVQLPTGGFPGENCWPDMSNCRAERSVYYATFVVYSLGVVDHPAVRSLTSRALTYIVNQMEPIGLWRFFDRDDPNHDQAGPDFDDSTLAPGVLTMHQVPVPDNLETLFGRRNAQGAFYSWVDPASIAPESRQLIDELKRLRHIPLDDLNDVDCGCNANVLWYLALKGRQAPEACDYLNGRVAARDVPHCSIYYPSPMTVFYMMTRAYREGASCLASSAEGIRQWLLELQQPDGSWGSDLETACAVASLLHLGYRGAPLDHGVNAILKQQQANGSWRRSRLFEPYHASAAVSTAVSLEALARYLQASRMAVTRIAAR